MNNDVNSIQLFSIANEPRTLACGVCVCERRFKQTWPSTSQIVVKPNSVSKCQREAYGTYDATGPVFFLVQVLTEPIEWRWFVAGSARLKKIEVQSEGNFDKTNNNEQQQQQQSNNKKKTTEKQCQPAVDTLNLALMRSNCAWDPNDSYEWTVAFYPLIVTFYILFSVHLIEYVYRAQYLSVWNSMRSQLLLNWPNCICIASAWILNAVSISICLIFPYFILAAWKIREIVRPGARRTVWVLFRCYCWCWERSCKMCRQGLRLE